MFGLKKAASNWFLALAALSLMLFGYFPYPPEASGRIYATYGGIYIALSISWLKFVDNIKLSTFDLIGAGIILFDTLVIVLGWRS
nr:YnfA family protein [Gilliamella apicola]